MVVIGDDEELIVCEVECVVGMFWDVCEDFVFVVEIGLFDEVLERVFVFGVFYLYLIFDLGDNLIVGGVGDVMWMFVYLFVCLEFIDGGWMIFVVLVFDREVVVYVVVVGVGFLVMFDVGVWVDVGLSGFVCIMGIVFLIMDGDVDVGI